MTFKKIISKILSKTNQEKFDKKFYEYTFEKYNDFSDLLVDILINMYKVNSVIDFGCGNGLYLKKFYDKGIKVFGYEFSKASKRYSLIPDHLIERMNLSKHVESRDNFDLAISFEVAEHLKEKFAKTFVANITAHSSNVIFSAAHPGQGGKGHYNERPQRYWKELFRKEGFAYKEEKVSFIKQRMVEARLDLTFMYPYINLMVFEKCKNAF